MELVNALINSAVLSLPLLMIIPFVEKSGRHIMFITFLGLVGVFLIPSSLLFENPLQKIIGIIIGITIILMISLFFFDFNFSKVKDYLRYLFSNEKTRFYHEFHKNRKEDVLYDYDEIQTMMDYIIDHELPKHKYATFITQVYYGYYRAIVHKDKVSFYHSFKNEELYSIKNGLRLSSEIPFDTDNYDTDEVEILVTKYKTSIDIIRSMIGKELNEETKQRIEDIWQSFAEDLEKGIEEVQKVKEMIKKQEHEAYELEQKRLQELLENEINWLRSDK